MTDIKTLGFEKADFEGTPEESIILKFPKLSITIFQSKGRVFAETLKGKRRQTYEGKLEDSEKDIQAAVQEVMKKLDQVVSITKMNK